MDESIRSQNSETISGSFKHWLKSILLTDLVSAINSTGLPNTFAIIGSLAIRGLEPPSYSWRGSEMMVRVSRNSPKISAQQIKRMSLPSWAERVNLFESPSTSNAAILLPFNNRWQNSEWKCGNYKAKIYQKLAYFESASCHLDSAGCQNWRLLGRESWQIWV